jgi:serine/threonine protein kinase
MRFVCVAFLYRRNFCRVKLHPGIDREFRPDRISRGIERQAGTAFWRPSWFAPSVNIMSSEPNANLPEVFPNEFLAALGRSGVLPLDQFEDVQAKVLRGDYPGDALAMAERLVADGVLTEFQARRLSSGNERGLVIGRYTLLDRIGAGAMGRVFKARHQLMDRVVAVKTISPQCSVGPDAVPRFLQEMKIVGLLDHPNVIRAFDADVFEDAPYLVMEYSSGENLEVFGRRRSVPSPFLVLDFMAQAALGLAHAHQRGVIHRDVKPSNLILDDAGVVKVLDLGLGAFVDDGRGGASGAAVGRTLNATVVGTADYMSPEQISGLPVDARTDQFSLGCTMYRLLTGAFAFPGETKLERLAKRTNSPHVPMDEVRSDVPEAIASVVDRLLANRPQDRYPSMAEAAEAMEALIPAGRPRAAKERLYKRMSKAHAANRAPSAEPDLPPLNPSLIEAALECPKERPVKFKTAERSRTPTVVPSEEFDLDAHRRSLEAVGEASGRDVHRQYYAELAELRRGQGGDGDGDGDGDGGAGKPMIQGRARRWLEALGEQLGDFLSEPNATQIIVAVMALVLGIGAALVVAIG